MTSKTSHMRYRDMAGLHHTMRIGPLLSHPPEARDLEWLAHSLQSAVSLEFSTIPPYLCALWSIKDENDPVAASIRNVVQEEMLHMSLACNMLTAIGGVPRISDPHMVPTYPGKIPGHVHGELSVSLSGLSDAALDTFIAIEAPSTGQDQKPAQHNKGYKTIGAFYDAILSAFRTVRPPLSTDRQITGPLADMVMQDLAAVEAAIALIVDQGEGSQASPEVKHTHELAHYYRFLEVRHGKRLSGVDARGQPVFEGHALDRPDAWPMAIVPKGGYLHSDVAPEHPEIWALINDCDRAFTDLLNRLQTVWEFGDQGALVHAIDQMFQMSQIARALMAHEIAAERGNYGPCFRYLEGGRTLT